VGAVGDSPAAAAENEVTNRPDGHERREDAHGDDQAADRGIHCAASLVDAPTARLLAHHLLAPLLERSRQLDSDEARPARQEDPHGTPRAFTDVARHRLTTATAALCCPRRRKATRGPFYDVEEDTRVPVRRAEGRS